MFSRKLGVIVLSLIIFTGLVGAQTADEIIEKSIEAKGGAQALKALKSVKSTGKYLMMGMEIPFNIFQMRPNYIRTEGEVQAQKFIQAYDGKTAWWINPFAGVMTAAEMPEAAAKEVVNSSDFDGHLFEYKTKGHAVELIGTEDVEGAETYKIKATLQNGDVYYYFFDTEYFLDIKVTSKTMMGETEVEAESYLSDYKEVGGLIMPHSIETKVGGATVNHVLIETVELNMEMAEEMFLMPKTEEKKE